MSTLHTYVFNNMGGLKADVTDQTQENLQNTRFGNYSMANYFSNNTVDSQVQFAMQQPGLFFGRSGTAASVIDIESNLFNKIESERGLEKLQLFARPFATVPYLGRGGGNPVLESQLQQGETIRDVKSVATISEMPYIDYSKYPMNSNLQKNITNPANSVEEVAMDGWIRGGAFTRD